jgi:hypothetical protein
MTEILEALLDETEMHVEEVGYATVVTIGDRQIYILDAEDVG